MFNPFKKQYKILETSSNDETYYSVKYGWLWGYEYLAPSGQARSLCSFWSKEVCAEKFKSVPQAEAAIKNHATSLIEKRLNKPTFKTVKYV